MGLNPVDLAFGNMNALRSSNERLMAENAKLRELCRHLYMCNQYCDREDSNGGCSACPYQFLEYDCGFEERLLKLGIEVDA